VAIPDPIFCRQCGYQLNYIESRQCPECGTAFDLSDPMSFRRSAKPQWPWEALVALVLLVMAAVTYSGAYVGPTSPIFFLHVFFVSVGVGFAMATFRQGRPDGRWLSIFILAGFVFLMLDLLRRFLPGATGLPW